MIHVRKAGRIDAANLADLLNAIIKEGGTTAHTTPVSRDIILEYMQAFVGRSAWHLAEDQNGSILGFQFIEPREKLPPDACDIATFTKLGHTQLGIGSSLFEHSKKAARDLGYRWINATIRADNAGGLAYYQSRGFEPFKRENQVRLGDGTLVDKISKRYEL